ncbi:hypothetical protein AYY17_17700 [Morganella psychrotolerans]|uniref:Uncharacterized protein n=1 Tax=Morganella psychrotolerans TaxID=368603 RepID=A0A1B8HKL8_9GAMM|nr:hypothetical protein AYY17_17700 [Morganella psychrotolerans]
MMLYTKIAAEIPVGTEITREYIREKYNADRNQVQAVISALLKTGAVKVTKWHGKLRCAFEILPCAMEVTQAYEKKTAPWNRPAERKSKPLTPRTMDRTDIAEYQFTEKQNRLISEFTAVQRELRKSNGVYFNG